MDGQRDGWMIEGMHGLIDVQMNIQMNSCIKEWIEGRDEWDGWMPEWINTWMDACINREMNEWMDKLLNGWMD